MVKHHAFTQSKLGTDFFGQVLATGRTVRNIKVGDRVAGLSLGSLRTHITLHQDYVIRLPEYEADASAATIPTASLVAYVVITEYIRARKSDRIALDCRGGKNEQISADKSAC
jgi:NADPH:quinone reductase-like Zn-dependent oxidoreductase